MMKRIEVLGTDTGRTLVFATNANGEGLFMRKPSSGAYQQIRGTAQFHSLATSGEAFLRHLKSVGILEPNHALVDSWGFRQDEQAAEEAAIAERFAQSENALRALGDVCGSLFASIGLDEFERAYRGLAQSTREDTKQMVQRLLDWMEQQ